MPRRRKKKNARYNANPAPAYPVKSGGHGAPPSPRADYDATKSLKKRQAPRSTIKSEDLVATTTKRRQLTATGQDQIRNFAAAAWMIRKHTSYVSRFNFHAATEDPGLERAVEDYITYRSHAAQFDRAGRLNRQRAMTMTEQHAVVDGDHFWHCLRTGEVQLIEGDLVYTPSDLPAKYQGDPYNWVHGVDVDAATKPRHYCLCTRDGASRKFGMVARAQNILHRAYWPRANTVRGISRLSSALNTLQDLYEGFDYQLIKAKLHALFGVAVLSDGVTGAAGFDVESTETEGTESDDDAGNVTHEIKKNWMKPGQATVMTMPSGTTFETFESKTPSGEFRAFSELMMQIAMLAVDLPFVFFNAKDGSFSIHRSARLEYEKSCKEKRDCNISLLDSWTVRQLQRGIVDGEFFLPSGWTLDQIQWEWVPEATPWFDEMDEIDTALAGIGGGIVDPYKWLKERTGQDGDHVLENIARFQTRAQELGLSLVWARAPITLTPSTPSPQRKDVDNG